MNKLLNYPITQLQNCEIDEPWLEAKS
ncbi:hypothetical protein SBA1_390007 [Candidatus Sulfotelmatobacter kueseliae]|uniref:Uncharacterized protein n=1 Tax=Candidatus Sulfotelmatobacter kueseliae TaxID=2042962 RepID=A0A2U3KQ28_9BACT|nr:hypothetical protein SBA1_390007 [Candidatus Sulfotelmatobacter kueseliae]